LFQSEKTNTVALIWGWFKFNANTQNQLKHFITQIPIKYEEYFDKCEINSLVKISKGTLTNVKLSPLLRFPRVLWQMWNYLPCKDFQGYFDKCEIISLVKIS
jgi:hypothetical protein